MKTTSKILGKALNRTEQSSTETQIENTPASTQTPQRQPLPRINLRERRKNRALPTESVLILLSTKAPRFWEVCEVVGKWVWIQFTEKQPREVTAALSELGFH